MLRVYGFFGGRSTTAFWAILAIGSVLAFGGKLTGEFVALVSTLHAFVIVRSISEDKFCGGKQSPAPADHASNSFDKTEHHQGDF